MIGVVGPRCSQKAIPSISPSRVGGGGIRPDELRRSGHGGSTPHRAGAGQGGCVRRAFPTPRADACIAFHRCQFPHNSQIAASTHPSQRGRTRSRNAKAYSTFEGLLYLIAPFPLDAKRADDFRHLTAALTGFTFWTAHYRSAAVLSGSFCYSTRQVSSSRIPRRWAGDAPQPRNGRCGR